MPTKNSPLFYNFPQYAKLSSKSILKISIFLGVTFSPPQAYNGVSEREVTNLEFILINDGKLKVVLTDTDLEDMGVSAEELDYSTPETKDMLREILSRAERELGFVCNSHRTLVQVYTSRGGGCEIFITRLGTEAIDKDSEGTLHYMSAYEKTPELSGRGIFRFEELEWLITVCRRLYEIGYSGNSSAYVGDDRRFYLMLDGLCSAEYFPLNEYSFISEYGESENILAATEYLFEHSKEICRSSAVETLSVL